jgi:hypothetical protein
VLPGTIESGSERSHEHASSVLGRLLARSGLAPDLLGEARHRHGVARRSTASAEGATRDARDKERVYANVRRRVDPRHDRTVHFFTGILWTTFLCAVVAGAVIVTAWDLGWLWRVAVPLIVATLAAAVAWQVVVRRRQGLSTRPFVFVAALSVAMLTILHVFTVAGSSVVAWLTGVGLAMLAVGAVVAATRIVEHTEARVVFIVRRAWEQADKVRRAAVTRAAGDEEAADVAEESWLSLVEEEAHLAVAEDNTTPESWVIEVVEHARTVARPND